MKKRGSGSTHRAMIGLATLMNAWALSGATTNVFIDTRWLWNGFENVYHQDGSFWTNTYFAPGDTARLQAGIDAAGTVSCAPEIRLDHDFHFDTNAWANASGDGVGICTVVSTFYADSTSVAAAGDRVVFSGILQSNTLAPPYSNSITAFIKDFNSSWGDYGMAAVKLNTLTNGQSFTIAKTITAPGPGNHVQWGFEWSGPPARTNAVAHLGSAVLASLPRPEGADVPWVTYEAEAMVMQGASVLGPHYLPGSPASEASGRRCARLASVGQALEFVAQSPANALVLRYSVPDATGGGGQDYTLSLYLNGVFHQKLPLTSKYSWLYGDYPFVNSPGAGSPRNFFDEVRVSGLTISSHDTIRIAKDAGDNASYYLIDFVDLENVGVPLSQPANSFSIANCGAIGDGVTDCTTALRNCISAAESQGKAVWIPPGNYLITGTIDLSSNTTIHGAGMWYTKLSGSPVLYNTAPSRRINLRGAGSNIHLADFAVLGYLNYRNDSEGNDGLGGAYGTGSTLSRLWIEHTKAGAWLVNSLGLVVDNCRFRNTIADGINLNLGMQNTLVTNCTARGTGDDGFAIWPAKGPATFPAGQNVIIHCTAQTPFLANGGAIYGGASNRIEDCRFQDVTYGCGVLLSTTFPVGVPFGGTTVARRSDLVRCGGFDPGYGWRAALQICMDNYGGISGVNLDHLSISNSVADGLSIIGHAGELSNARLSHLNLSNFGLGVERRHGLWARNESVGSLTVSDSANVDFMTDSRQFTFYFTPPPTPRILGLTLDPSTNLVLTCTASPTSVYHLEFAAGIAATAWTEVAGSTTNAEWNVISFGTPVPSGIGSRFYRVASP